ncbi:MAG: fumarylacetoacetate hydrolase family protein [Chloroflexi bacterium]|nr:fumarylacetoacetate hydrolase family protein [Chloroflexota bacterium]
MRFARAIIENRPVYAIVEGDAVKPIAGSPFAGYQAVGESFALDEVKLLAPVEPSKIVAVGLNYRDHALELGMAVPEEPVLFMKPATAVIGTGDAIVYPAASHQVEHEAELAIVIKKRAKGVSAEKASDFVLGYTCANDVTARDLQNKDGQWTRCKGFDTFCPLGPWVETELDPADTPIESLVNGEVEQSSTTANFIFDVQFLIEYISGIMTLLPGDVILTGTPAGVGPMLARDTVEVRIGGIGSLVNAVI